MVGWSWKTGQSPGKSQSAYSALIGDQGNMYMNFTSGVQVSHSAPQPHPVLLVFKPITGLQAYNRTHPPGMGCKVWYIQYVLWTTCSLGNTSRCNIPLLRPLPGVHVYVSLLCVTISFMVTGDFVCIFHVYVSVSLESCTGVEYLVIGRMCSVWVKIMRTGACLTWNRWTELNRMIPYFKVILSGSNWNETISFYIIF